jgi:predicted transcriptional regulator
MKLPRFTLRGFKRPREAIAASLGKLERDVLEEVWRRKSATVRDIHLAFDGRFAYTTLMTTLDRLYKKGLLERRKESRAFLYTPKCTPDELERGITTDIIDALLGREAARVEPVLACIVDAVSERDRALLDELDRLIKEKRRELKRD